MNLAKGIVQTILINLSFFFLSPFRIGKVETKKLLPKNIPS